MLAHTARTPVSVRELLCLSQECVLLPFACLAPIGYLAPAQALLSLTKLPCCAKSLQSCPTLCGRPRRCPHLNSRTSEHFPFYSKMDFIDVVKAIEKQKLFWFM